MWKKSGKLCFACVVTNARDVAVAVLMGGLDVQNGMFSCMLLLFLDDHHRRI